MKVKIIRGVRYERENLEPGTELDLPHAVAMVFLSQNQAELVNISLEDAKEGAEKSKSKEVEVEKEKKKPRTKKVKKKK